MGRVRLLAVVLALAAPLAVLASDPPHEAGPLCINCHLGHNTAGGSLTKVSGNFNLCQSFNVTRARSQNPPTVGVFQALLNIFK